MYSQDEKKVPIDKRRKERKERKGLGQEVKKIREKRWALRHALNRLQRTRSEDISVLQCQEPLAPGL